MMIARFLALLLFTLLGSTAGDVAPLQSQSLETLRTAAISLSEERKPVDTTEQSTTEEVQTSTPMPNSPPAILESIAENIVFELNHAKCQWLVALVAAASGLVMIIDGEFFFKWLVVSAVFLVTGIMAMNEFTVAWDLSFDSPLRSIIGIEAGAVGAYAAFRGIDGVQIVIGAMLGLFLAQKTINFLAMNGVNGLEDNKNNTAAVFSLFVLGAVLAFGRNAHVKMLAMLSSAIGAALLASSIAFAFTELALKGYLHFLHRAFSDLSPTGGTWVQFFLFLCVKNADDVGIFADSEYNFTLSKEEWRVDRLADGSLCFVFFVLGTLLQLRRQKQRAAICVKESLTQPLLTTS